MQLGVSYVCHAIVKMSFGLYASWRGVSFVFPLEKRRGKSKGPVVVVSGRRANAAEPTLVCRAVVNMSAELYSSWRGVSLFRPMKKGRKLKVKNRT